MLVENNLTFIDMKRALQFLLTAVLVAFFGIANAQTTRWYGYVLGSFGGEAWQHKFISFETQAPGSVQTISETLPDIQAATYVDGYVWFATSTRSLCKAPFDEVMQTFGTYETVVPTLLPYNQVIDMAYNPMDAKMYLLCQDSQYNMNLKRIDMAAPSVVEDLGSLSATLWTLAIDSNGTAYGIGYPGDLYQVNLGNCALTMVGATGKDVWYTQSMAFDLDTNELYWAQVSTNADHGFYQVNTVTGAATPLGEIGGSGAQLTGLFMVPQNVTPEPEIINEIYVEGFTEPVWGEHPDFDLEVANDAHYSISEVIWAWVNPYIYGFLEEEDIFNREDAAYSMGVTFVPEDGYVFAEDVTVFFNGDSAPFNADGSGFDELGNFQAGTIDYYVTDPTNVAEQTIDDLKDLEGQTVSIYDLTGRLVLRDCFNGQLRYESLKPGLYFATVGGCAIKFVNE